MCKGRYFSTRFGGSMSFPGPSPTVPKMARQPIRCFSTHYKTCKSLWSAICFKIMTRYTCGFFPRILAIIPATRYTCVFLSRILAFYSQVYDHFLTNAHIYANKKTHIYVLQTSMWYMQSKKVVV